MCELWREALLKRGFLEIQSSKFQASGTESGAAVRVSPPLVQFRIRPDTHVSHRTMQVFKVDYFRRPAFLAQSPQLAKQMCIASDMERVFEIGPGERALEDYQ